jgi:DNA-directed RNA polymerase subunit RPC12/RpoP
MDITFPCFNCGQELTVDESGAGLTVPCPNCGHNLTIPAPPAAKEVSETTQNPAESEVSEQIGSRDLFYVSANSIDGNFKGPLTLNELVDLYHKGDFESDAVYSKNNSEQWRPISEIIPMLKDAEAVPPRAPAAPPMERTGSPEPSAASSNKPTSPGRAVLDKLLKATEANDYDSFVADGADVFKAALTKQKLDGVSAQLSPRMKKGYRCAYLGELSQHGCQVLLWKLTFKDGGDDTLAKLVLKDGKVAGFWLQ